MRMEMYVDWYANNKARLKAEYKKIKDELSTLLIHYNQEELEARFLKNFGCINFIDGEKKHELDLARAFHDFHKKLHPELHNLHEYEKYHCYRVTTCKCGFEEAVDSSD